MSVFALIENGVVVDVINATQDFISKRSGMYVESFSDGRRYNQATIGGIYDSDVDAFIGSQPSEAHVLFSGDYRWYLPDDLPIEVEVVAPNADEFVIRADGVDKVRILYTRQGATSLAVEKLVETIATGSVASETVSVALDAEGSGYLDVVSDEGGVLISLDDGTNVVQVKAVSG